MEKFIEEYKGVLILIDTNIDANQFQPIITVEPDDTKVRHKNIPEAKEYIDTLSRW